jgi:hypothetical protein
MAYQDLLKDTTAPDPSDKDAFLVTVVDLNPDKLYPLQFRWKYKDGSYGQDWSPSYDIYTGDELVIPKPYFPSTNATGGSGFISITWDGRDSDLNDIEYFDRVDILIKDYYTNSTATFGDGTKATAFFKSKGTKTIVAPAGKYIIKLRTVGKSGKFSDSVPVGVNDYLVTVTSGLTIEDPTLPVGLSVSTVPFGVAVNWSGAYNAASFFGFQSINIYASTTDYGASTNSTNITNSKLVGTMSVNDSANKITVGLDALRTALGLSANKDCYTTNTYFYYIATNLNGVKYKVDGAEVYTRISSTPVKPTQANFIDLAAGVISIENLVAGNGKFTTYLQTGTPDGARIELNGGNSITPSGQTNPILPGLSVYSSGSTAIFRADLSGNISFGGYTPSDIATINVNANKGISDAYTASQAAQTASDLASTKNKIFVQDTVPSAVKAGDVWVNTYNGTVSGYLGNYTNYVATASGTSSWLAVSSVDAKTALGKIVGFNSDGTLFSKALNMPVGQGAIYSNKSAYNNDSDEGWYLGYIPNTSSAAIALGSSGTGLIKWDPSSGLRLTGNITSSATISGGTLIGGTIKTRSSGSRVEMTANSDSIAFYSGAGNETAPGQIISSYFTFSGVTSSLTSLYSPSSTQNSNNGGITAYNSGDGSYGVLLNGSSNAVNTGTFRISQDMSGVTGSGSTSFVRNVYIRPTSDGAPVSAGINGDIWLQY